ncbi:MAG: hypothetical protein WAO71_15335 [Gallionella sp.]
MARINVFMAWFFIPITLGMGWVAAVGRIVLELLGMTTREGDIPGLLVGAVFLFATVFLVRHFRGSLPPEGKPSGKGYLYGHRLVLAGNILAAMFVIFQITHPLIANHDVRRLLDGFTDAFGYWTLACWAIGFSLLYQSSLPVEK